jgi:hypothetical protein
MLRRIRVPQGFALGFTLLLAFAGCSNMNMPTQPLSQSESAVSVTNEAPEQVLVFGGGSTTTTRTKTIGLLGGTVSVGDFTVVFPPAALTTPATVTVSQPDLAKPVVNLSISPASANKFLLPVILTASANRMDRTLLSVACISYYNPTTGKWEDVAGSSVSLLNLTVSAPLWHFSTYRVSSGGKAGW